MTRKAAIIGGGVIGGGWAARFLLNGWDVGVFDSDPRAKRKINAVLANVRLALPAFSDVPMPPVGKSNLSARVIIPAEVRAQLKLEKRAPVAN